MTAKFRARIHGTTTYYYARQATDIITQLTLTAEGLYSVGEF